jgi:hypothetical protein
MAMQTQFDPELVPDLFQGEFTSVLLDDPAIAGHVPNLVLNSQRSFSIHVSWKLTGTQVPLYMAALTDQWDVTAYAESIGPGPEVRLAAGQEPKANATISSVPTPNGPVPVYEWRHTLQVPAGLLPEGGESGRQPVWHLPQPGDGLPRLDDRPAGLRHHRLQPGSGLQGGEPRLSASGGASPDVPGDASLRPLPHLLPDVYR